MMIEVVATAVLAPCLLITGFYAVVGWLAMGDQCPYGNDCADATMAFQTGLGASIILVVTLGWLARRLWRVQR